MRVDYLAGCSGAAPNKPPAVIVPLARAAIDLVGNLIELLLAVDRQVRALGQVLAHQSIGVFVEAALSGAVRVADCA